MKIQKSPNWWSCLATAFAIALELPVRELIGMIGHDGSELIFNDQPEPYSRRAFHVQELIEPCRQRGYALLIVEAMPILSSPDGVEEHNVTFPQGNLNRLAMYMSSYSGVVAGENNRGNPHAVAWDGKCYYDPNNDQPVEYADFGIREFFALVPLYVVSKSKQGK